MPTRRLFAALFLAVAMLGAIAAPTYATDYEGSTASWGKLTATVSDGTLTAFRTKTGRLQTCSGQPDDGSPYDPQDLQYAGEPVAVVGGKFHLEGTTKDDWGDPFHWAADGSVSLDGREISGTVTTTGDTVFAKGCVGTWNFDAIIPAHQVDLPVTRTFASVDNNRTFNPGVAFSYRRGVITHLTALSSVECPGGSVIDADINTTAYDLDPIRVDKAGRFSITGAVIDGYGVVNHYVLHGRIKGHVATGTLSAFRYDQLSDSNTKCTRDVPWKSTTRSSTAIRGPSVYFDVDAYRYGAPGAWSYYLQVAVTGCLHANRARVAVAGGPSKTVGCHHSVRLGPLTPKRTYRVKVTALRTGRGRVVRHAPAVSVSVYLPGEDGIWVRQR
jgi:hypothetical protein